jgi:hypothetical protein
MDMDMDNDDAPPLLVSSDARSEDHAPQLVSAAPNVKVPITIVTGR